jgi:hypothetical protein
VDRWKEGNNRLGGQTEGNNDTLRTDGRKEIIDLEDKRKETMRVGGEIRR